VLGQGDDLGACDGLLAQEPPEESVRWRAARAPFRGEQLDENGDARWIGEGRSGAEDQHGSEAGDHDDRRA
jgi:hypothetical protein